MTGFRPASDHTLFLSKTCLPSSIDGGRDRPHGDDMGGFSSDDDYNRHNKDSNTNVHRWVVNVMFSKTTILMIAFCASTLCLYNIKKQ